MYSLSELKSNLAFTCKHEPKPTLSADTQKLYDYARYHDLHNLWKGKRGDAVWQNAAVYYRIAAANGDYKA
ncbi:sel1 repeat family protein, partial [Aggregatibacter actinomycetemcomitans]|nr:sel1 repeat family protein [Aggregatibacter actinomycetemcomitans]